MIDPKLTKDGRAPHCDQNVLHAPGECKICDEYAAPAQQDRIARKINFTNHFDADKSPCPSWIDRGQAASLWEGNAPWVDVACSECGKPTRDTRNPCLACELKKLDLLPPDDEGFGPPY
jgi:hypothetical protein